MAPTQRRNGDRPLQEILDAAEAAIEAERPMAKAQAPVGAGGVEGLIAQRQNTHGEFGDNARVSQAIKRIFRGELGWEVLTDTERESMDMIALKFSRILSGKSLEKQHWEDVVGYGKLAERLCK
jgi:hypothetical protein